MTLSRPSIVLFACSASACLYSPDLPADATGGGPSTGPGDASEGIIGSSTEEIVGGSTSAPGTTSEPTTAPNDSLPDAPTLHMQFSQIKQFDFSWSAVAGADYYRLFESVDGDAEYVALVDDIFVTSVSQTMPLHLRAGASYLLEACNVGGCTPSAPLVVADSLAAAVGYFKASNPGPADAFGIRVALSGDGKTMAVAATGEDGEDAPIESAGAVYIFVRDEQEDTWAQQALLRAPHSDVADYFGFTLALSTNGDTLAVGVPADDSAAIGIDGDDTDDTATDAGAVHVFTRTRGAWVAQAYLKASNAEASDRFGGAVALSGPGDVLAVGAEGEDDVDDLVADSGAVYVFTRDDSGWSETDRLKPKLFDPGDRFGSSVALSEDGTTLVAGAEGEASGSNDATDNTAVGAGAVYVFVVIADAWTQQRYLKPDEPQEYDHFGASVALSGDGTILAVGAPFSNGARDTSPDCGAAHVFERRGDGWTWKIALPASNSEANIHFGGSVALSKNGAFLAVGAVQERGGASGVDGEQTDTSLKSSGAVYVFDAADGWIHPPRYIKASNPGKDDRFGALALSADGRTLAVGAYNEDSANGGIGVGQGDHSVHFNAGAVYLY